MINDVDINDSGPDLAHDLYHSEYIRSKSLHQDNYCQNIYAALCNHTFQKINVEVILRDQRWSCSWRYAGGIAASLYEIKKPEQDCNADYMMYYCTGMQDFSNDHADPNFVAGGYVNEGVITDEIRADLLHLGWTIID